jgi:hypothetical protein
VLVQMLAKEPDGRPSLQQVRALFEASHRSVTPAEGVPAVKSRPAGRVAAWIAAGATAVLAGVGAAGYALSRRGNERPPAPKAAPTPAPKTLSSPPAAVAPATVKTTAPAGPALPAMARLPVPAASAVTSPNAPATLIVRVPPNAHIRINGQSYSAHGQPMLRLDVPGGEHKVQVTAGRLHFEQRVRVAPGATAEVLAIPAAHNAAASHAPAASSDVPKQLTPPFAPAPAKTGNTPEAKNDAKSSGKADATTPDAKADATKPDAKPAKPAESPHGDYTLDPFK